MMFGDQATRMTIDLVLGVPSGRHITGERAPTARPEDDLELYGRALTGLTLEHLGEETFASWSPKRRRELGLVRAHLAPIRSRQSLAASFGRESFHRREAASVDTARDRLISSPVLAAYATRWLELADS